MDEENKRIFFVIRIVAILMLFWALDRHQTGYFTILRFLVTITAAWSLWVALSIEKMYWVWIMGGAAILFNPVIPIYLNRDTWAIIDILMAIIFVISLFKLKLKQEESTE